MKANGILRRASGAWQLVRSPNAKARAFTLVELLVTIAIIAILASLVLTGVSRAKTRASGMVCLNNLNQLGKAFVLYHMDHAELFPGPGSRSMYGPQPEDWIWWQHDRDVNKSAIVPFIARFVPGMFTCSFDREGLRLQQQLGLVAGDPYRYSYALTSYSLSNEFNPGMSTIITKERKAYPFRASAINQPAQKVMVVEEDRETIDDPRWVPEGAKTNLVANRHEGKGYVVFADGHNEKVTPTFGMDPRNNYPPY